MICFVFIKFNINIIMQDMYSLYYCWFLLNELSRNTYYIVFYKQENKIRTTQKPINF